MLPTVGSDSLKIIRDSAEVAGRTLGIAAMVNLIRPSTLRPVGRPTQRKRWTSRGWTPFGVGPVRLVEVYSSPSPTVIRQLWLAH